MNNYQKESLRELAKPGWIFTGIRLIKRNNTKAFIFMLIGQFNINGHWFFIPGMPHARQLMHWINTKAKVCMVSTTVLAGVWKKQNKLLRQDFTSGSEEY